MHFSRTPFIRFITAISGTVSHANHFVSYTNIYPLQVEGGKIDHALHEVNAKRALVDLLAMEEALETAMQEMESELDETLIIVTADHSHVMTINGYPKRGNPILGTSSMFPHIIHT